MTTPHVVRRFIVSLSLVWCLAANADDQQALPVAVRIAQPPAWVRASDGQHALYELQIINFRDRPLTLERIEIHDDLNRRTLLTLDGAALRRSLVRPGVAADAPELLDLNAGQIAIAFIDVPSPGNADVPHVLSETLQFRDADQTQRLRTDPHVVGDSERVLGAPVSGSGWIAANGLSNLSAHRRALLPVDGVARIAQRFAIDLIRLGDNGRLTRDDSGANESFFAYGAPLLAVADGTVAALRDGIPENRPLSETLAVKMSPDTILGDFLILDIGGAWVVYSHIQPGSLRTKIGERVKAGDELARLGNSGNSDAPHLQIQVVDRPASIAAEGLPFGFSAFVATGRVEDLDELLQPGSHWSADSQMRETRERQLPLTGDVIDFGP